MHARTHTQTHMRTPHPSSLNHIGWILQFSRTFGGFATSRISEGMHEVEFYQDREGVTRAVFRRHVLSSTYIPEGPGYPVFSSPPTGAPQLAPLKADSAWKATKAHGTPRHTLSICTHLLPEYTSLTLCLVL